MPSDPETAGLGRRAAGLVYEALLLTAILFTASWAFLLITQAADPALAIPLLRIFLIAVSAAYFIYCWTRGGQTLPMKTWHMRLVTRERKAVSLRIAFLRYLCALAGIALGGIGLLWALFDRERQFLHDRLAGTLIIRTDIVRSQ